VQNYCSFINLTIKTKVIEISPDVVLWFIYLDRITGVISSPEEVPVFSVLSPLASSSLGYEGEPPCPSVAISDVLSEVFLRQAEVLVSALLIIIAKYL